jgi:hypothetical protein
LWGLMEAGHRSLRPFLRRAASTLRPLADAMRVRKPEVRARALLVAPCKLPCIPFLALASTISPSPRPIAPRTAPTPSERPVNADANPPRKAERMAGDALSFHPLTVRHSCVRGRRKAMRARRLLRPALRCEPATIRSLPSDDPRVRE